LNHKKYFFYNDLFWKKVGCFGKKWERFGEKCRCFGRGRFELLPKVRPEKQSSDRYACLIFLLFA
jgi:hypothetical protein